MSAETKPPLKKGTRTCAGPQRQKAWRAMQIKGKFSLPDLCRCVLTGQETAKDPRHTLRVYVIGLAKVGILSEMKKRQGSANPLSRGDKRWLLVRDLGRQAPVVRSNGEVFDPNASEVIPSLSSAPQEYFLSPATPGLQGVSDEEAGHDQ